MKTEISRSITENSVRNRGENIHERSPLINDWAVKILLGRRNRKEQSKSRSCRCKKAAEAAAKAEAEAAAKAEEEANAVAEAPATDAAPASESAE